MTSKIAIIGLGQIGASIGLALRSKLHPPKVIGFDKDPSVRRMAEQMGAVEGIASLKDSVRDAELVILALPLGEIRETLRQIGPVLMDEAVLMDTAPLKRPVAEWVREFVPAGRYYLGLVPAITTEAFGSQESGVQAARADLFKRTVMILMAPAATPPEVEQLGINLAKIVGAKPMLTDPVESDGLMATAHLLPQLTAAALLDASVDGPGWIEARKMAGRPFADVTGGMAHHDDPQSLSVAALSNPSAVLHALDAIIASLTGLRGEIERGDERSLSDRLKDSYEARERWLDERGAAEWLKEGGDPVEMPAVGEQVMQMLFGGRAVDRLKKKK